MRCQGLTHFPEEPLDIGANPFIMTARIEPRRCPILTCARSLGTEAGTSSVSVVGRLSTDAPAAPAVWHFNIFRDKEVLRRSRIKKL